MSSQYALIAEPWPKLLEVAVRLEPLGKEMAPETSEASSQWELRRLNSQRHHDAIVISPPLSSDGAAECS
jgi:hypothetical protein